MVCQHLVVCPLDVVHAGKWGGSLCWNMAVCVKRFENLWAFISSNLFLSIVYFRYCSSNIIGFTCEFRILLYYWLYNVIFSGFSQTFLETSFPTSLSNTKCHIP